MNKKQVTLLVILLLFTFFVVFIPHITNRFPVHIDEWHHITESIRLTEGGYEAHRSLEIGFHLFLAGLGSIFNLVLIYQFMPAIWAVLSAFTLFLVINKKFNTDIALLSVLFFASIRSNVNLTGLWFFTPLTFCIPLVFLYIYFFTEGLEKKSKKNILISFAIMLVVLFTHPISLTFAIPFLALYSLLYKKFLLKEWKFFSIFLSVPIIGIIFFSIVQPHSILEVILFRKGWGVLEIANSVVSIYSWVGLLFGILGIIVAWKMKKKLVYTFWVLTVYTSIIIFLLSGISFLVPFQRNVYYFALGMCVLSAFGLNWLLSKIKWKWVKVVFMVLLILFTFRTYFYIPNEIALYKVVDEPHYEALMFLKEQPKGIVLGTPEISTALYPITRHEPLATIHFYGDKQITYAFFATGCEERNKIIERYNIKYIIFPFDLGCDWKIIYDEEVKIYGG